MDSINFLDQAADVPVCLWPVDEAEAPAPARPADWAGHVPAGPSELAARPYGGAAELLREHADTLDINAGLLNPARPSHLRWPPPTAAELRAAAEVLEGRRPSRLPRRVRPGARLRPGFVQALLDNGAVQQARAEAVDVQFVVAPHPDDPPGP